MASIPPMKSSDREALVAKIEELSPGLGLAGAARGAEYVLGRTLQQVWQVCYAQGHQGDALVQQTATLLVEAARVLDLRDKLSSFRRGSADFRDLHALLDAVEGMSRDCNPYLVEIIARCALQLVVDRAARFLGCV